MPRKSATSATLARRVGLLRLRRYVVMMMMVVVVVVVNEVMAMMVAKVAVMMMMDGVHRRGGIDGRDGEADDQGRGGEQFLEHDEDLVFCDSPTSEASAPFC
jgi:hypothetical protein